MKDLTSIEKEILKEIAGCCISDQSAEFASKAAAIVAKKWIEKAWEKCALIASRPERGGIDFTDLMKDRDDWLKSNGII
jgi:hypothetical protein